MTPEEYAKIHGVYPCDFYGKEDECNIKDYAKCGLDNVFCPYK